ncbi:MAG: hypothetical protein U0R51_09125 [Solirubrobacterales bacterium]
MGAPAISPRTRPAPRPKPRPKAKPKPRTATRTSSRSGAAAPARRPARRTPAAAPRTNHRSRARVAAGGNVAMLPVTAVSGIADSGFVVGMSRSRAWIVVLGVLLGGIVALNVVGLSLSASSGSVSAKIDELQQANSVARARIANRLSNERITEAATALGLAVPAPDAVHYLDASSFDAEKAAQRLADGLIANEPPAIEPTEADLAAEAAAATTTTDPAVVDPTAVATTTVDPAATVPTTTP